MSKAEALENLKKLLERESDYRKAMKCVQAIGKLEPTIDGDFKHLEQLSVSDEHNMVRSAAVEVLGKYHAERLVPVLEWIVKNEQSLVVLWEAYHTISLYLTRKRTKEQTNAKISAL
ncbi:MAG: hypothetical protein GF383_06240 [Candidatus Lokiarchaeota archaeon]|nr:hypothetical protein [Candidatus Lokiarchaeota archaeon]